MKLKLPPQGRTTTKRSMSDREQRSGTMKFLVRRPPAGLVLVLVLVGFLLVVTGTATTAASEDAEPRKQVLIDQILQQRSDVNDLDQAVAEVRGQVDDAQREAGQLTDAARAQDERQRQLALQAGTADVEGDGVVIELSDAPRRPEDSSTNFDSSRIQDSDIQLVVNALFATGAEAVSINGNRVVAVTPIRAAGATIVVNYRPVSSPYEISAIGVEKDRFEGTDIASYFEQWRERFDLGYSLDSVDDLEVPGYAGRTGIDVARSATTTTAPDVGG
jgi:uncharacterized protein YlxW (UPF0749 family)